jgi:hypothetical protein
MERLDVTRIAMAKSRPHVDWSALEAIRGDSADVDKLLNWLSGSLEIGRILPYQDE